MYTTIPGCFVFLKIISMCVSMHVAPMLRPEDKFMESVPCLLAWNLGCTLYMDGTFLYALNYLADLSALKCIILCVLHVGGHACYSGCGTFLLQLSALRL